MCVSSSDPPDGLTWDHLFHSEPSRAGPEVPHFERDQRVGPLTAVSSTISSPGSRNSRQVVKLGKCTSPSRAFTHEILFWPVGIEEFGEFLRFLEIVTRSYILKLPTFDSFDKAEHSSQADYARTANTGLTGLYAALTFNRATLWCGHLRSAPDSMTRNRPHCFAVFEKSSPLSTCATKML